MNSAGMRVLHVMPSLTRAFGGPTQSWVGFARAARTQGIDVSVIAPRVSRRDQAWLEEKAPGAICKFFRSVGKGGITLAPGLLRWLGAHGQEYDAIHVHGLLNPISSLALRMCTQRGWPVVSRPFGTLSTYTFNHRRSGLKSLYFRNLDGPSLVQANGVHFTTDAERDEAAWHGINFQGRSHVVPPPLSEIPYVKARPTTEANVLFLSRLHPKKNVECILEAWPLVQRILPKAKLVIAGSGKPDYEQFLEDTTERLCKGLDVTFTGFVDGVQKTNLIADASVFVLPSFQENFGVAVMEAIAAGLPVVISHHVQLASYVAKHNLGHVIDPDPEALAFSLIEVLKSDVYRKYCEREGPACIKSDFSPESVGRQLSQMYLSVINQKALSAC